MLRIAAYVSHALADMLIYCALHCVSSPPQAGLPSLYRCGGFVWRFLAGHCTELQALLV